MFEWMLFLSCYAIPVLLSNVILVILCNICLVEQSALLNWGFLSDGRMISSIMNGYLL
jgi:hypothetical protein